MPPAGPASVRSWVPNASRRWSSNKGGVKPFDDRRQLIGSAVKQYVRQIKASPDFDTFSRFGGAGYIKWADDMGVMGTRNYRQRRFEMVDRVDGRQLIADKVRSSGCYRCPVQCKADLKFSDGPMKGRKPPVRNSSP
jgi:aldehyde:ferredoxin oxidoreductase